MDEKPFVVSSWKRNNGGRLVGIACLISLLTCGLWYSDVLPRIELTPATSIASVRLGTPPAPPITLVLTMVAPPKLPTSPINGIIEVHPPFGKLTISEPLLTKEFVLVDNGVESVAINQLVSGEYALLVYLDENKNGQLDFDDEGRPAEIYRTAAAPASTPDSLQNESALLQLKSGSPLYLTFYFEDYAQRSVPQPATTR